MRQTLDSLKQFNPLFFVRYSATHKTQHNRVHRLDALDAYNRKLVKKIAVRGITTKGLTGTNAYLYLEAVEVSKQSPIARIELEIKQNSGPKRTFRRLQRGDNLYDVSGEMDQYKGFVVSEINAKHSWPVRQQAMSMNRFYGVSKYVKRSNHILKKIGCFLHRVYFG